MAMGYKLLVFGLCYLGMEWVAWALHKYVMHGPLWVIHRSHHQKGKGFWEWNDLYFLFFALVGSALMVSGAEAGFDLKFFAGLGITAYGFTYLVVHDWYIHRRFKWIGRLNLPYLEQLKKAHQAHHRTTEKEGSVNFGMLWINQKNRKY